MIIYIAGKYNSPTKEEIMVNVNKAIDTGIEVYKKGHYPVIPHLTHWIEARMNENGEPPRPNEYWYDFDNLIIPKCDALLKISPDRVSKGADAEEALARKLGKKIYYRLVEIPIVDKKTGLEYS